MKLSDADGNRFYELWLPLLDYVNEKKEANLNLRDIRLAKHLDPNEVKKVADVLWSDVSIIDEYLEEAGDINGRDRELLQSWKRCINGRFILERILKKGAILISLGDEKVYQVAGIKSTWDEMFGYCHLPLMISAALIPFGDVIISDGLVQRYNIMIGGNMAKSFKEVYMTAKNAGRVYRQL